IDEGGCEAAAIHRSAVVAGIHLLDPLVRKIGADFGIGDQHGAGLFQDIEGIADMIAMAVREQHVRDTFGGSFPSAVPGGISRKKRIDEDSGIASLDPEGRMSVPGYFHSNTPRLSDR